MSFFTVAKNGDQALACLEIFWRYFCSVNTFHLNGDYTKRGYSTLQYRPFPLEGNFCALDVLQEMMLYSENGVMELFPAIPEKWKNASFQTLRAWGGVLVSAELHNGALSWATFAAERTLTFFLRGLFENTAFTGGNAEQTENGLRVSLQKGETMHMTKR